MTDHRWNSMHSSVIFSIFPRRCYHWHHGVPDVISTFDVEPWWSSDPGRTTCRPSCVSNGLEVRVLVSLARTRWCRTDPEDIPLYQSGMKGQLDYEALHIIFHTLMKWMKYLIYSGVGNGLSGKIHDNWTNMNIAEICFVKISVGLEITYTTCGNSRGGRKRSKLHTTKMVKYYQKK